MTIIRKPVELSIIVPYRADPGSRRERNWTWLRQYWRGQFPDAQILVGRNDDRVFSKTRAVNNGVRRSRGKIIAMIDADCYMDAAVIQDCVDQLLESMSRGIPRWFIPYRSLYRLTDAYSETILRSDPLRPYTIPSPPAAGDVEDSGGSLHGRRYGALITIYPREAFDLVGGMDWRFVGWGGEDISWARALDTLYAKHKTTDNDVTHLWHDKIGGDYATRTWAGQGTNKANGYLAMRYSQATGDRVRMRSLVDEGMAAQLEDEALGQLAGY